MKTIGLIGGMSWESTATYYRLLNEFAKNILGGHNSAKIVLSSVNFQEIYDLQHTGTWYDLAERMTSEARRLEVAGCDAILICTNTMHKVFEPMQAAVRIPIIHIADVVGAFANSNGMKSLVLTGTKFTMEEDFYKRRLQDNFGLSIEIPNQKDRNNIHDIIFQRLCKGIVDPKDVAWFDRLSADFKAAGHDGLILGCTELAMLTGGNDPFFLDTTTLHAKAAIKFMIES